ncbi:MAG: hypothetical protein E6Q50_03390 [Lysobacter sp.]|nr:MAG: hypothetical protein E6Q50_03390 [Lysobacter sp.]
MYEGKYPNRNISNSSNATEPLKAEISEATARLRMRQCERAAQVVVAAQRKIRPGTLDGSDMALTID